MRKTNLEVDGNVEDFGFGFCAKHYVADCRGFGFQHLRCFDCFARASCQETSSDDEVDSMMVGGIQQCHPTRSAKAQKMAKKQGSHCGWGGATQHPWP